MVEATKAIEPITARLLRNTHFNERLEADDALAGGEHYGGRGLRVEVLRERSSLLVRDEQPHVMEALIKLQGESVGLLDAYAWVPTTWLNYED